MAINRKVMAYRRANGKVGVRNHVIILPVDDISNACVEKVAAMVPGTLPLPHAYGRLQFGDDLDLFFRTIIGTGRNPNVAAVIVIGIEPGWTQKIVDGIAETGKPVQGFAIERRGDLQTAADAARVAQKFLQDASEIQRTQCDFKELYITVKCGESDTTTGLSSCPTVGNVIDKHCDAGLASFGETTELTGGEHIVKGKAANKEVEAKFTAMFDDYQKLVFEQKAGTDLSESQPTKGNIIGGLSTIEEKALGNIEKLGKRTKFIDALKPAEEPRKGPGLYFMDTSSAAAEAVTLWMASGGVIHLFPTGQGNVIGNPVEPVIKLSGNPITVKTMTEHIDLDVSAILRGEMTIDEAGDELIEIITRTANGRLTCAEALGHKEYVMTKLYRSA
ncbi:MAG TPA: UxaA family hydrolase [Tepidisphaeraceae bacterium]|jgi:(2R)-sulfolactate sulfo-lyase subunit beta|nr:UxaA family hydrolase [Tepidisphaeraceae bacterium]